MLLQIMVQKCCKCGELPYVAYLSNFIKKDLGLIESLFASDLLFYFIVWGRKSLAACFCFCEVWHAINGVGRNRLVAVLRNQVSCGLLFLHTCLPLLCSPTHTLWRFKPDLQASFSVLISCLLSRDCQPWQTLSEGRLPGWCACLHSLTTGEFKLSFTVLTNGTVGFAWIWAGYSAAGSNLQSLFFYCHWLSSLLQATLFFSCCCFLGWVFLYVWFCFGFFFYLFYFCFSRVGGYSCHPYTLPSAISTPRASPPFAATTEWWLYRHFPTCWHLFTWVCANCTLSCFPVNI